MTAWISRTEAARILVFASRPGTLNARAAANKQLAKWRRSGEVRTKDGGRPSYAKHARKLYRRADIEAMLRARDERGRRWSAQDDALIGTDYDRAIARKLGATTACTPIGCVRRHREQRTAITRSCPWRPCQGSREAAGA